MPRSTTPPPPSRRDIRDGLRDIFPIAISCVPIALIFGTLAVGKGLSVAEAGLMSAMVFAGGAQFAGLELWVHPLPILALAFSTLLVNIRLILMSASLGPKLGDFSPARKLAAFFFLTDETWALAERRAQTFPVSPAYWLALCLPLFGVWVASTLLGAWLGSFLGDPARFGADFALAALFIGLIAGFWRGPRSGIAVAAAGIVSALVYVVIGPPWHIGAGALAGIAATYIAASRDEAEP